MNRVEVAISEGRCVLVFGSRALGEPDALGELRRRAAIPSTVLGGEIPNPASALNADTLAPALGREGGVVCLIEADTIDSIGLGALAALVDGARHKPRLIVASRAFNPFMLPQPLRLLKFDHDKKKAKDFLQSLPIPTAAPVVVAAPVEEKKKASGAPRAVFVGRADELASLGGMLDKGGPIAIVGPSGVGKRWLVEKALLGRSERRLPDFHVGWGSEADSLFARLAMFGGEIGDRRLGEALRNVESRPIPSELVKLAVEILARPEAASSVFVIERLDHVLRRDGTFHRESRLEMLLRALLAGGYGARVVFLSSVRPRFYREGEGANLQVLELGGLLGRELHEVFDAYRVEDFPREHFGSIINRIHGHPLATRLFAVAVRDLEEREELLENVRFMQMDGIEEVEVVRRRLQRVVEHLPEDERGALGRLAHFRLPVTVADCEAIHVDRRIRLALLGRGLLDQRPESEGEKVFHVHPLVGAVLGHRETSDYGLLEHLGNLTIEKAGKAEGLPRLALAQEGNRLLFEAHRVRDRMRTPFPDHDPALESVRGMVRSKKPRFDLAEQRLGECLDLDPANPELALLQAELVVVTKGDASALYTRIAEVAPTPEVFHQEATFHLLKSSGRGKAAAALERGSVLFPENGRLRRRLAGVLVEQNKFDEAARVLDEAMALEPMMPDTYGLLGEIHLMRGPAYWDAAEDALTEARRLDPDNGLHMARHGALIVERGLDDEARREQARELLKSAIEHDAKNYLAHLYLGRLLVHIGDDLDQADFLLRRAQKLDERAALPLVERARVAVRRQQWAEADQLTEKAIRQEPSCHEAFFARGEMCFAQGNVFVALAEFQRAHERSTPDTQARRRYDDAIAKCKVLIESGSANEMLKAAEEAGIPKVEPRADAVRREPGKTTRRRRGKGGDGVAKAESAPGEGEATEGTPAGPMDADTGAAASVADQDGARARAPDSLRGRKPDDADAVGGDATEAGEGAVGVAEADSVSHADAADAGEKSDEASDGLAPGDAAPGDAESGE